jgi:catechol 2,3-dioxygenase-like lactoylglutathione lyase family enzyme
MQPLGIHHVSINVTDVDAALAFYTGALGLTVREDRPDFGFGGAWLDAGGQQIHLIGAPTPDNLGQHLALQVADLDTTVAELRAQGIDVTDPSPVGPGRQSFLVDPSGNAVELYQRTVP